MIDTHAFDTDQLGYNFFPPAAPHTVGHSQLKVVIRPAPTEAHYDPESLTCSVAGRFGGVEPLRVHHPWLLDTAYRVCAGHVTLDDRKGKRVTAFTFGGELHIEAADQRTVCRLTSPAPILHHPRLEDSLERRLGEEVEILFAERRAAWLGAEEQFERRLAQADPLALYYACLTALGEKFDCDVEREDDIDHALRHFLRAALAARSADAAMETPSLAEIV